MPYTVFGLPTHILIIHLAVVGIPAACLATLAIAVRAAWRRRFGYWVAGLAVLMVPVTYLTQLAGEQLYNHNFSFPKSPAAQHKSLGETLVWFVAAVAILAVALVIVEKMGYADHHAAMVVIAALAIGASAICLVRVVQVGDSGARAAWGGYTTTHASN
jgi:heme/copper-type cytochrome/quinol oxidase subunit 4